MTADAPSTIAEVHPTWDVARLFPNQGQWEVDEYLALTHATNRLVEFTDGYIEVLGMPNTPHQFIVAYLLSVLSGFMMAGELGRAAFAPLRVRLRPGQFREPDIVFLKREHLARIHREYWEGADLVVEVVSDDPESRRRDLVIKRAEYAAAEIAEYWIIDPRRPSITVLALRGAEYQVHSEAVGTGRADSALLNGFSVDLASLMESARI